MTSTLCPPDAAAGAVRLPAHCTTVAAPALHAALRRAADTGADIAVDASEVESLGQAVLQLLLAARAAAAVNGARLVIERPSGAFIDRVAGCGLDDALGIPMDEETVQ